MIPKTASLLSCVLAAAFGSSALPPQPLPPSLASLVETERAFAKMSVDRGRRTAFLAFFDEDALFFTPEPARARPIIGNWPEQAPFVLDWEPRFGDVARAGDLGYTTGPFVRTSTGADAKVMGTGWYFTIWKKVGASWTVAIDAGVATPGAGALRPATFRGASTSDIDRRRPTMSLAAADRSFCDQVAATGAAGALASVATDETIVFREGEPPLVGRAAFGSYFASHTARHVCQPIKDEAASSGDLGYTYGKSSTEGPSPKSGSYVRVWKQRTGEWKLAIEVLIGQ